jgi:hypothetical protein
MSLRVFLSLIRINFGTKKNYTFNEVSVYKSYKNIDEYQMNMQIGYFLWIFFSKSATILTRFH